MIVTVTPNPSIDRTLSIPPLERGGVHRASSTIAEAGGKGINVARALATHGFASLAVAPLSTASAAVMRSLLAGAAPLESVEIHGDVRINVSLVEEDGTVTKVNEAGPNLSSAEVEALLATTVHLGRSADWIVACGSLPPGVPDDFFARLAARAPSRTRVAIDTDGVPLRASIGEHVDLVKPNLRELEVLAGRELPTLGAVVLAADDLVASGLDQVLVSLGPDGALLVDRIGTLHAEATVSDVRNTVGAGDALLAGFLASGGNRAALGPAVAWSVAACRSPGTAMRRVSRGDLEAVLIRGDAVADRRLAA
jgi:1-phosphofructokinase family hexose kinase